MRRLLCALSSALIVASCSSDAVPPTGPDAGALCKDEDHDGFGLNCSMGVDCDDHNPSSTNECRACSHPEIGCACKEGQEPLPCFGQDEALLDGNIMCHEGTRFCRDQHWSACEDVHGYVIVPDRTLNALINPDAAPVNCSKCDVKCFKVSDPLLASDGGTSNLSYSSGGGLHLSPIDSGMGTGDSGISDAGVSGCAGLAACCSTLTSAPSGASSTRNVV